MTDKTPHVDESLEQYSVSSGFAQRLANLGVSFLFTSYQSSVLYCVGHKPRGGLHVHRALMPKPMGLCQDASGGLFLAGGGQILHMPKIAPPASTEFDAWYIPRRAHITGSLDAHEIGVDEDERPIFVNTRFNCLATVSERYSFEPVWMPPFITGLVDEDRCHLNGLAMAGGVPRAVTAISRSNTIDGWRDRRADGGVVVDVDTGEFLCTGLSMPHSPRLRDGKLWVLNSGAGELGFVEGGRFEPVVFCPGFLRGLSFVGDLAFVGLSKPRYKRFEGLELDRRLADADSEPWCGIQVIDLSRGICVDWFRIDGTTTELYDVHVLPGIAMPLVMSPLTPEEAGQIVLPPKSG